MNQENKKDPFYAYMQRNKTDLSAHTIRIWLHTTPAFCILQLHSVRYGNHHSFLLPRIYHSWMHFIFEAKATGPEAFLCCPVYDRRLSVLQWQWKRLHRISGPNSGFYIRDYLFFLCHISGCQWTTEHEYFQTYFLYASHGIPHDFCSSGSDGKSHISSQCKCLACHDFHVAFSVLYQCLRISERSEIYRPSQHYDP